MKVKVVTTILLFMFAFPSLYAGDRLELTPNEVFFDPVGTLFNVEDPDQTGTEANRGLFFTHITDWRNPTDTILWAVDIKNTGELKVTPVCGVGENQVNSTISVYLNDVSQTTKLTNASGFNVFEEQESSSFNVTKPGRYYIKLTLNSPAEQGKNVADLQKVVLSGEATEEAATVIRRWRPYAVHAKWNSSREPGNTILAVHENTIETPGVPMYQPITTPFGYVGSPWNPDDQEFSGFNFSLWSYGQNDPTPPFEQLSHLVAVGAGLEFGEFGHEGTGVKPRGPIPYKGHHETTQVLAIRAEPGEKYNSYWAYYLDPEDGDWKIWGCGKQYNDSGNIRYLRTGAFVEEPGRPAVRRNGHLMREVSYRAWHMDEEGQWYNIDQMLPGGNLSPISYKKWGTTEDGKFFMQMGGMGENDTQPDTLELPDMPPVEDRPDFIQGDQLEQLFVLPATIDTLAPATIEATEAELQFDIQDAGTNPEVQLFWGRNEGLTFDYEWAHAKTLEPGEGIVSILLEELAPGQTYYYRLRIKNEEGITWSMHTQHFTTPVPDDMVDADFEAGNTTIMKGQSIAFTNNSLPEDASYEWSFEGGDPSSSTQKNPVVTYNEEGVYDVSLTVTNDQGHHDTKTIDGYISVAEVREEEALDVRYSFRKNMFDLSGNNHHGHTENSLPYEKDEEKGWVAWFDGEMEVEMGEYEGISGSRDRTMTAWIRTTPGENDQVIFNWGRTQAGKKNTLKINEDGYLRFEVAGGFVVASDTRVDDNNWHHVASVFEDNENPNVEDVRLYVNGRQETAEITPHMLETETFRSATIGNDFFNMAYRGYLYDARIYNIALSEENLLEMAGGDDPVSTQDPLASNQDWITISPGEAGQLNINLKTQNPAEVFVYDLTGALLKKKQVPPGSSTLQRPAGRQIHIIAVRDNIHPPYSKKILW